MPPITDYLKYVKLVKNIVKAIKTGDMSKLDKLLNDVPPEAREKIKAMADSYRAYKEGKVSKYDAMQAIAKEMGIDVSVVNDILELIDELVE